MLSILATNGGQDPGAVFLGIYEKDIALQVAKVLADILADQGHQVTMTRTNDSTTPISTRANKANFAAADLFLSLHMNADPDEDKPGMHEARGAEIWIYPASWQARRLANAIGSHILQTFPDEPWRGVREQEFGVLKLTTMPAVLIEMGFIDNSHTIRTMTDPGIQLKMAWAISRGVKDYLQPMAA